MKALEMMMDRNLKAHKHYKLCLKCGHVNNGELDVYNRICRCAAPILYDVALARGRPLHELGAVRCSGRLGLNKHFMAGAQSV